MLFALTGPALKMINLNNTKDPASNFLICDHSSNSQASRNSWYRENIWVVFIFKRLMTLLTDLAPFWAGQNSKGKKATRPPITQKGNSLQ
jgi:hypothetical protein